MYICIHVYVYVDTQKHAHTRVHTHTHTHTCIMHVVCRFIRHGWPIIPFTPPSLLKRKESSSSTICHPPGQSLVIVPPSSNPYITQASPPAFILTILQPDPDKLRLDMEFRVGIVEMGSHNGYHTSLSKRFICKET